DGVRVDAAGEHDDASQVAGAGVGSRGTQIAIGGVALDSDICRSVESDDGLGGIDDIHRASGLLGVAVPVADCVSDRVGADHVRVDGADGGDDRGQVAGAVVGGRGPGVGVAGVAFDRGGVGAQNSE